MSNEKESPNSQQNQAGDGVQTKSSSSPDNENDSHSSFGNVGDPKKKLPSASTTGEGSEQKEISRLSRYQMWNANSNASSSVSSQNQKAARPQQSQLQDGHSNFHLPSEFESLKVNDGREPNSGRHGGSSLAMAAGRGLSTSSVSSGRSTFNSDPPQRNSSLLSARDQSINNSMRMDSAPPGFHSPISVNPSNRGGTRNQSRGGNPSNRGGGGDFRLKDHRYSKQNNRRLESNSQSDNLSGKWSSASSQNSHYSSYSSASYPVPGDRNRRGGLGDDMSYRSHTSSHARSEASLDSAQGSSLLRYAHSSQSFGSSRSGGGDNMATSSGSFGGSSYKRRERRTGATTQSSSAIQKMLEQSAISPEAVGLGGATLPSLTASSVYSDIDEQHAMPKKASGGALSFSLPPHSFLPGGAVETLDQNYLEYTLGDDGDGSKASRSTASTVHRSKGKNKDWRLKMNRLLAETPLGELDSNEIPISVLMNEWAKTKSSEGASMVETLLNRAEEEVKAGNTSKMELTTKMYTIAVDAWAKSREGGKAARRAESILQHMFEMYKSGIHTNLKPSTGIFNAVVNSWAQSRDEIAPARCEQILNWMDELYRNGNNDVKPDTYTYNTVMHAHVQSGKKDSATKVQSILDSMNRMYREGNASAKPETITYNIVINALAKSGKVGAASEAENLLSKMHMLHDMGDPNVKPNVVTYCAVIDAYAKSMASGAASRGDTLLANMIQQYQSDPVGNSDMRPNTHVFNTVINCWSKSKDQDAASKAEEIFFAMEKLHENGIPGLKPDAFTYTVVIDAWAKTGMRGAASRAEALLSQMESKYLAGDLDLKPNTFTYNAVINSLAKSGEPGAARKAERVLQNMVNRYKAGGTNDVKPTTIHFNAVLDAFAKSGGGRDAAERAESILEWMDDLFKLGNSDVKPDTITFNAVIDCWARSGDHRRAAERAEQILNHMDHLHALGNKGIKPDSYTYNTVINAWAKSGADGAAQNAENVLERMEKKYQQGDSSLKPNTRTYTSLIDCWAKSGEPLASKKAEQILITIQAKFEQTRDPAAKPNTHTANAVMNACAFTTKHESKSEALAIAFRVFEWLLMQRDIEPDAYSYTIMLSVCANLLPRQDKETRYSHARDLFLKCRESGHVNDFVLRKLRHTVTQEEYLSLVDYRVNSSASNLPPSWTRNARIHKSSNRSKGGSKWSRK